MGSAQRRRDRRGRGGRAADRHRRLRTPIGLHEARHTYASYLIASGVDRKAISEYMGHTSVAFTYDRYGKLLPGSLAENAAKLDAFLVRARSHSRSHED